MTDSKAATFISGLYACFTSFAIEPLFDNTPRIVRGRVATDRVVIGSQLIKPVWNPDDMHYLIAQIEKSPTTGKEHWQGYVEFKSIVRRKKACALLKLPEYTHMEKRLGSAEAAADYCIKEDTAIQPPVWFECGEITGATAGKRSDLAAVAEDVKKGMSMKQLAEEHTCAMIKYHKGIERTVSLLEPELKVPVPEIELRPWQTQTLDYVSKGFRKRQLLWIWSFESETGKSTFSDYLTATLGFDQVLSGVWTKADMLYLYKNQKVVVWNLPRQQELHNTHLAVLESFTDGGAHLSTKYEPKMKILNAVCIVFANIPPPEDLMPRRCINIHVDGPDVKARYEAEVKAVANHQALVAQMDDF